MKNIQNMVRCMHIQVDMLLFMYMYMYVHIYTVCNCVRSDIIGKILCPSHSVKDWLGRHQSTSLGMTMSVMHLSQPIHLPWKGARGTFRFE